MIAGNGAVVYDIQNDKIIYEKYIPKSKAIEIIKICEQNSIFYDVYTNKSIIASSLRYNVLYYYKENLKKEDSKKTHITLVENVLKYIEEMQDEKVMKIYICDSTKSVFNSILRKLDGVEDVEILEVSHMSRKIIKHGTTDVPIQYFYTEISMKDVDKWYAIEFLLKKLNINKDEVITIGDNTNENQENKVSDNKVTKYIEDAVRNAADETKSKVKETLAENISLKAIEILTWIVVFVITRAVLLLLKFFADGVANLPIIKQLNGIGGIVYGTAKGLIIVYLILTILFFVVSANSNGEIANAIDNSSVTKFLYDNNIIVNYCLLGKNLL